MKSLRNLDEALFQGHMPGLELLTLWPEALNEVIARQLGAALAALVALLEATLRGEAIARTQAATLHMT